MWRGSGRQQPAGGEADPSSFWRRWWRCGAKAPGPIIWYSASTSGIPRARRKWRDNPARQGKREFPANRDSELRDSERADLRPAEYLAEHPASPEEQQVVLVKGFRVSRTHWANRRNRRGLPNGSWPSCQVKSSPVHRRGRFSSAMTAVSSRFILELV